MASVFKPAGSDKYVISYTDAKGKRSKKIGTKDKSVSQRIANDLENKVALRKQGLLDPSAERLADAERKPLVDHITDWQADLTNRGGTAKHADLSADRVRRLVGVTCGAKPDEVDCKRITRAQCRDARERLAKLIGGAHSQC
jgi:hypothetical protein